MNPTSNASQMLLGARLAGRFSESSLMPECTRRSAFWFTVLVFVCHAWFYNLENTVWDEA
jgi:hypothetical protein